ncbi:RidA family protein [Glacieibacterium frigidum]|uniref:Endonuclease n=1 Tax=Glacieibacterium frigidum TaxID=2593303 RepID=A0A552U8P2_9SPHN|nr:RidA family protein [Glacieibacterium frigidum]TRW14559.1 endonuclease [Glacieibacterium frigidum]
MIRTTLAALSLVFAASAAPAAEILRHAGPAGAIILQGVTVPAGAETLHLSGQVAAPIDPAKTATLADFGDTRTQTISVLRKIEAALVARGYTMADVVKLTVFVVADPALGRMDFAGFNAGYRQFFGTPANPNLVARSTVQVAGLAGPGYLIEIEAMAAKTR